MQHLWNYPEEENRPAGSTNIYPDHFVGRLGALAAVAGLFQRERTGVGYHAEAAQFEGAIGFFGDWLARESLAPGSVRPRGNASERGAPWGVYPCAGEDEWVAICVRSDAEWQALCEALDSPEWTRAPGLETTLGRIAARAELDRHLAVWTRTQAPHAVMHLLQARGVPAGALHHPAHEMADPHLRAWATWRASTSRRSGGSRPRAPSSARAICPRRSSAAPMLGQHSREVCREWLALRRGDRRAPRGGRARDAERLGTGH
jgi:crotonobetainyl-CoA:carnitine CoA-transferase CaiB-like acyl-CoA transferase